MLLYELLTMSTPYADVDRLAVYDAVVNAQRLPVQPIASTLVDEQCWHSEMAPLIRIYKQCTRRNPAKRPTAVSLLRQLQLTGLCE